MKFVLLEEIPKSLIFLSAPLQEDGHCQQASKKLLIRNQPCWNLLLALLSSRTIWEWVSIGKSQNLWFFIMVADTYYSLFTLKARMLHCLKFHNTPPSLMFESAFINNSRYLYQKGSRFLKVFRIFFIISYFCVNCVNAEKKGAAEATPLSLICWFQISNG